MSQPVTNTSQGDPSPPPPPPPPSHPDLHIKTPPPAAAAAVTFLDKKDAENSAAASISSPASPEYDSPATPLPLETQPSLCTRTNTRVVVVDSDAHVADDGSLSEKEFGKELSTFKQDLAHFPVIGVDAEWGEKGSGPSVVQLASLRICFVLITSKAPKTILPFVHFLRSPTIVKAGVGIRADTQRIEILVNQLLPPPPPSAAAAAADDTETNGQSQQQKEDASDATAAAVSEKLKAATSSKKKKKRSKNSLAFEVHGDVDLAALVCRSPESNLVPSLSLARITQYYVKFAKPSGGSGNGDDEEEEQEMEGHLLCKELQCSDWSAEQLSAAQIEYAADDAVAGLLAFRSFFQAHNNEKTLQKKPVPRERVADFCKVFLKKKVTLRQPKTPKNVKRAMFAEQEHLQTKMEKRYRNPQETADALERVKMNGVKCLSVQGQLLFVVEPNKASWYCKKGLARIVEAKPYAEDDAKGSTDEKSSSSGAVSSAAASATAVASSKPHLTSTQEKLSAAPINFDASSMRIITIQLNFEPSRKTRVCRSWHMGSCQNRDCPYAHGADELVAEKDDDENPSGPNKEISPSFTENKKDAARKLDLDAETLPVNKKGIRVSCDMCYAQDHGAAAIPVVPAPVVRLMGERAAAETGSNVALHCCCKCQALVRAVHVSERRLLVQDAKMRFEELGLSMEQREQQQQDDDDDDDGESTSSSSSSSSGDDDEDNDDSCGEGKTQRQVADENDAKLMSRVCFGSMNRMVALCLLLKNRHRVESIPAQRVRSLVMQVNCFYDKLVDEGLVQNNVDAQMRKQENVSAASSSSDQQLQQQEKDQLLRQRAQLIASELNKHHKSDWLAATEARDLALFFLMRPADDRERTAGIYDDAQVQAFSSIAKEHAAKVRQQQKQQQGVITAVPSALRVADDELTCVWAPRIFEYFRTVCEQQLRPVVVPWRKKTVDWKRKQQLQNEEAEDGGLKGVAAAAAAAISDADASTGEKSDDCCYCCQARRGSK